MNKILLCLNLLFALNASAQISLVKDITPGATGSAPSNFFDYNGTLLFRANDSINGVELWKTNGTAAGTSLVSNIAAAAANSNPSNFLILGNTVYFNATTGTTVTGSELYKTDGTTASTVLVKDINTGTASSNPQFLTKFSDTKFVFAANDGTTGVELYESDGTTAGTKVIKDYPGTTGSISDIQMMKGVAYTLQIADAGRELYKSDGTAAGSSIVKDINAGTGVGVNTELFVASNNVLYFAGNDGTTGTELWKSDGTTAGTVLVKELNPGTGNGNPRRFVEFKGKIYFNAAGAEGVELWESDGTAEGTKMVANINTAAMGSSNPDRIIATKDAVYFFAQEDGSLYDFYKYDGTTLTKLVDANAAAATVNTNYAVFPNAIYFSIAGKLYRSDGTITGTYSVASKITGSIDPTAITNIIKVGNLVYFNGTLDSGAELYKFDPAALTSNKDIVTEEAKAYPNPTHGILYIDQDYLNAEYTITSATGATLQRGIIKENQIQLPNYSGMQILRITKNEKVYAKKLINLK
jgi:ELWxxDGT repeat protein